MKIETYNIFLDTGIFESENFFRGRKLKTLGHLSKDGIVNLKITDIVYNEILGRFRKNLVKAKSVFRKADNELDKGARILKNLEDYSPYFSMPKISVEEVELKLKAKLDDFITDSKIEIIDCSKANVREVFNQYFGQERPFGEGQKKSEFPDAFTLNIIEQWCKEHDQKAYIFALDKDITEYKSNSGLVIPINDLAQYLDTITKVQKGNARIAFIEKSIEENYPELKSRIGLSSSEDVSLKVYEQIASNAWYEDLEYEDDSIEDIEVNEFYITEINEYEVYVELEVHLKLFMTIRYDDLTEGIYDREDGVWFNVKRIREDKNFGTKFIISAKYDIDLDDDEDPHFELSEIERVKLIEIENESDGYEEEYY